MKSVENIESQSFSEWLSGNKKYFLFIFSIFPILINILLDFPEFKGLCTIIEDPTRFILITSVIQCMFILFAIFLPVKEKLFLVLNDKSDESDKKADANKAIIQFKNAWTFVWASWLFFLCYAVHSKLPSLETIYFQRAGPFSASGYLAMFIESL